MFRVKGSRFPGSEFRILGLGASDSSSGHLVLECRGLRPQGSRGYMSSAFRFARRCLQIFKATQQQLMLACTCGHVDNCDICAFELYPSQHVAG